MLFRYLMEEDFLFTRLQFFFFLFMLFRYLMEEDFLFTRLQFFFSYSFCSIRNKDEYLSLQDIKPFNEKNAILLFVTSKMLSLTKSQRSCVVLILKTPDR